MSDEKKSHLLSAIAEHVAVYFEEGDTVVDAARRAVAWATELENAIYGPAEEENGPITETQRRANLLQFAHDTHVLAGRAEALLARAEKAEAALVEAERAMLSAPRPGPFEPPEDPFNSDASAAAVERVKREDALRARLTAAEERLYRLAPWGALPSDATDPNRGRTCGGCHLPMRAGARSGHRCLSELAPALATNAPKEGT